MRNIKLLNIIRAVAGMIVFTLLLVACGVEDPVKEDTPELVTKVTLTFAPAGGGEPFVVTAADPDGEGIKNLQVNGAINLAVGQTYTLGIDLINELADPSSPEYSITDEVSGERDEHMFFFGWTSDVFADPAGNGNIDNRSDDVNYNDEDSKGYPLGLSTGWTTSVTTKTGTLHILLKHQPGLKSDTSGTDVGETDLDVTFDVNVVE